MLAAEFAVMDVTGKRELVVMHPQSPAARHAENLLKVVRDIEPKLQCVQLYPFAKNFA